MITIYHNPRCSKSRQALSLVEEKGEGLEVREYLKNTPSAEELKEVIKKLGIKPIELVRKGEPEFKEHFKDKDLSDDEWVEAMVRYPKLIERPIVIVGEKAVIGRPPEKVIDIL